MYLLWLRVAAFLYAGASIAAFPAVLYGLERWRKTCIHMAGLAFFFHFVSVVEMLVQAHHLMPVGVRDAESLLGLVVTALFLSRLVFLRDHLAGAFRFTGHVLFWFLCRRYGADRYTFPSQGVRMNWLIAHIAALLAAYAALGFSLLASVLYLVQERRLKSKRKAEEGPLVAAIGLASAPRHPGAHRPRHVGVWLSLHDRRPRHRLRAGAGNPARRRLFP